MKNDLVSLDRKILDRMVPGVHLVRASDSRILYCNEAMETLFGYGPDELVGQHVSVLNAPQSGDPVQMAESIRLALTEHGRWAGETHNARKDGSTFWSEAWVSEIEDAEHGRVWITIHTDITERREQEAELRSVYHVPSALVIVADPDANILRVSDGARGILGYEPEEMLGRPFFDFIHPDDLMESESEAAEVIDGKVTQNFVNRYRHKDGVRYRTLAWSVSVDPTTGLAYGLAQDVTEARQAEAEIRRANAELEQHVRERTAELAERNVSLEREIAERLQVEERLSALLQDRELLLREIHHRVKNNLQIVSSLLFLQGSRREEGEVRSAFMESQGRVRTMAMLHEHLYEADSLSGIPVERYLESLTSFIRRTHATGDAEVELCIDTDGPSFTMDTMVPLGLIVNELVTNALKHAFPNGRAGRVGVALHAVDGAYQLTVGDDGVGLGPPQEDAPHRGLGLRLVRSLVEQLDGAMTVEVGADGSGTLYKLTFPDLR